MRKFGLADEGRMKTMRAKERHCDGQAFAFEIKESMFSNRNQLAGMRRD